MAREADPDRCWCGSGLRGEHANGVEGHYTETARERRAERPSGAREEDR